MKREEEMSVSFSVREEDEQEEDKEAGDAGCRGRREGMCADSSTQQTRHDGLDGCSFRFFEELHTTRHEPYTTTVGALTSSL